MSDEDYWLESKQVGFDFGDNTEICDISGSASYSFIPESKPRTSVYTTPGTSGAGVSYSSHTESKPEQISADVSDTDDSYHVKCIPIVSKLSEAVSLLSINPMENVSLKRTSPRQTILNIVYGLDYNLDQHKSLEEKELLLTEAIQSNDANTIIIAVLFLHRTLNRPLFEKLVFAKPIAVDQYLQYLIENKDYEDYEYVLQALNRTSELNLFRFKSAYDVEDKISKLIELETLRSEKLLKSCPFDSLLLEVIEDYIKILKRQMKMEIEASNIQKAREELAVACPQRPVIISEELNLFNKSIITTLFYAFVHQINASELSCSKDLEPRISKETKKVISVPYMISREIQKDHQLTEKQYILTEIAVLAKMGKWEKIVDLFKGNWKWFMPSKEKFNVGYHNVIDIAGRSTDIPLWFVLTFLKKIEDFDIKLRIAKQYKCYDYAIEILITARDRNGLQQLRDEIGTQHPEYKRICEILSDKSIKWIN